MADSDEQVALNGWSPAAGEWLHMLTECNLPDVAGRIWRLREEQGDWFKVADWLGEVARVIGQSWADDDCTVVEQHIATVKLSQAIAAVATAQSVRPGAPLCLVATLNAEPHGLGALLAQFCLRCQGLNGTSLGTLIPADEVCNHLETSPARLLALSASSWQGDAETLAHDATRLGAVCEQRGITLVLGGDGAWPDSPGVAHRCRSFVEFRRVLEHAGLG